MDQLLIDQKLQLTFSAAAVMVHLFSPAWPISAKPNDLNVLRCRIFRILI